MPAITVVVTTHNLEKYIGRCLEELCGQTMRDFDVLLVDDASTDGTVAVVEAWRPRFGGRLHTLYLAENLGRSALTRNAALDSGRIDGDYVLFLDGDDSIEHDMLAAMHARATELDADVVICAYDRVDAETGRRLSTEMRGFPKEIAGPDEDAATAFVNTSPWNKLWRRAIIAPLRFDDFGIGEEIVFNFNAYTRCDRIVCLDEVLIHYTVRRDSVLFNIPEEAIRELAEGLAGFYGAQQGIRREAAGFLIFLHVGFSMALLAHDNPEMDTDAHLAETARYFRRHFDWFSGNRFFRLASLRKRKLKGLLIWAAFQSYRCGCFGLALRLYRRLGLRIKF